MSGVTVGELREALRRLPADMEIVVRATSDDGNSICGGIANAGVDTGCNEDADGNNPLFFAIEVEHERSPADQAHVEHAFTGDGPDCTLCGEGSRHYLHRPEPYEEVR